MTTLYVDRRDASLSLQAETLVIRAGDERARMPLSRITRLVVRAPAQIDASLMAKLWSQGSGLLILSGRRNEPTARMAGHPNQDIERRRRQMRMQDDAQALLDLARPIVRAKIIAQGRTLAKLAEARSAARPAIVRATRYLDAAALSSVLATTTDQLRGYEGAAASAYWSAYASAFAPSLGMTGRNRRPPRDPVNVALSLAYTLAHFEAARQAEIIGLDPMLGALHAPSRGRDSLASDLIEPLRPRIDYWVWKLFADRDLRVEQFTYDGDERCLMGKAGRGAFYVAWEEACPPWNRWLRLAARAWARRVAPDLLPVGFETARFEAMADD